MPRRLRVCFLPPSAWWSRRKKTSLLLPHLRAAAWAECTRFGQTYDWTVSVVSLLPTWYPEERQRRRIFKSNAPVSGAFFFALLAYFTTPRLSRHCRVPQS